MTLLRFTVKLLFLGLLIALRNGLGSELLKGLVERFNIFNSLLNFLIFITAMNLVIRLCQFIYRKRKKFGHKYSDNVIIGLQNIYYILSAIGIGMMFLGFFGLEPIELLTSISIVAAAIAIISKELVTDIICGINISFSRELAIGDYVRLGEQKGTVIDINIHKIVLLNDNDDIIFIPNTKAYYSDIVNFTQKEIRKYNLEFGVSGTLNLSKLEIQAVIFQILDDYTTLIEPESSTFRITSLVKDEIKYKFQFKLKQVNPLLEQEIKAKVLEEVHSLVQSRKNLD